MYDKQFLLQDVTDELEEYAPGHGDEAEKVIQIFLNQGEIACEEYLESLGISYGDIRSICRKIGTYKRENQSYPTPHDVADMM